MRISLELKDLLSFVAKLRQDTLQFTLLEALLGASNRTNHGWRTTYKDLGFLTLFSIWKILLDVILRDVALLSLDALGILIKEVNDVEAGVLAQLVELLTEQNVSLCLVAIKERHLGLVGGVRSNFLDELPHGRDARASSNHTNFLELVRLVGMLGDGTLEAHLVTSLETLEVLRHLATRVVFDEQNKLSLVRRGVDWSVGADDGLSLFVLGIITSTTNHKSRRSEHTRALVVRKLKNVEGTVVVVRTNFLELQSTKLFIRKGHIFRVGVDFLQLRANVTVEAAHAVPGGNTSKTAEREVEAHVR